MPPTTPPGRRLRFATRRKADGRLRRGRPLGLRPPGGRPAARAGPRWSARPPLRRGPRQLLRPPRRGSQGGRPGPGGSAGVTFCYLPPYSPELNPIEPVWRQVKYQDIPERSHPTDTALQTAVETALTTRARRLPESTNELTSTCSGHRLPHPGEHREPPALRRGRPMCLPSSPAMSIRILQPRLETETPRSAIGQTHGSAPTPATTRPTVPADRQRPRLPLPPGCGRGQGVRGLFRTIQQLSEQSVRRWRLEAPSGKCEPVSPCEGNPVIRSGQPLPFGYNTAARDGGSVVGQPWTASHRARLGRVRPVRVNRSERLRATRGANEACPLPTSRCG